MFSVVLLLIMNLKLVLQLTFHLPVLFSPSPFHPTAFWNPWMTRLLDVGKPSFVQQSHAYDDFPLLPDLLIQHYLLFETLQISITFMSCLSIGIYHRKQNKHSNKTQSILHSFLFTTNKILLKYHHFITWEIISSIAFRSSSASVWNSYMLTRFSRIWESRARCRSWRLSQK